MRRAALPAVPPAGAKTATRVDRLPDDLVKLKRCLERMAREGELRACYEASEAVARRVYLDGLPTLEYPGHYLVKKVTTAGTFRFRARLPSLANVLANEHIGLEETDDGVWAIHFHRVPLATFDERDYIITG